MNIGLNGVLKMRRRQFPMMKKTLFLLCWTGIKLLVCPLQVQSANQKNLPKLLETMTLGKNGPNSLSLEPSSQMRSLNKVLCKSTTNLFRMTFSFSSSARSLHPFHFSQSIHWSTSETVITFPTRRLGLLGTTKTCGFLLQMIFLLIGI